MDDGPISGGNERGRGLVVVRSENYRVILPAYWLGQARDCQTYDGSHEEYGSEIVHRFIRIKICTALDAAPFRKLSPTTQN